MSLGEANEATRSIEWTGTLIRMLRGKRTQSDFEKPIGAPKNTVWRWESGLTAPHPIYVTRLNELAQAENFLADWRPVGSIIEVADDLEGGSKQIADAFRSSILLEESRRPDRLHPRR